MVQATFKYQTMTHLKIKLNMLDSFWVVMITIDILDLMVNLHQSHIEYN